jgi:PAS domain-containing protein
MAHEEAGYLRNLFDRIETGILIADDSAFYVDVNRAACELFGRSRSEIVGHHLSEFIEDARSTDVDIQWSAFLRDGSQSGAFTILLPDRSTRPIYFHAQAHFMPGLHCSFITLSAPSGMEDNKQPEEVITMCAWTKRVRRQGRWIPLEEYLYREHGLTVTHGICPEAMQALRK